MTAHTNGMRLYSNPVSRLSPFARRYLQQIRHIPVHAHSRRNSSLYEVQDISISPLELIILLLSVGLVIGILFFIALLAIQSCITSIKRRFGSDSNNNKSVHLPMPKPCQRRRSSCERSMQRSGSYMTAPEVLRSPNSMNGLSKNNTYGTLDAPEPPFNKHTLFEPEPAAPSRFMALFGRSDDSPAKHTTLFGRSDESVPSKHTIFGTPEREALVKTHAGGSKGHSGYYGGEVGQTPWNSCERQEQETSSRDSPSSGRSIIHREDCDAACGTRRRSIDRFIV